MSSSIDRRTILVGSIALAAVSTRVFAQDDGKARQTALGIPDMLPDVVQGRADAPVTMIEYASMTCTHCARFHATVYPTLLKDYIDTGKVKFILRELALDPLAIAAFMLARCSRSRHTAVIDLLFDQQASWAFVDNQLEALAGIMKQTGMGRDAFDACLEEQALYRSVVAMGDRAAHDFDVTATPTFFVNGKKVTGEMALVDLEKMLNAALGHVDGFKSRDSKSD